MSYARVNVTEYGIEAKDGSRLVSWADLRQLDPSSHIQSTTTERAPLLVNEWPPGIAALFASGKKIVSIRLLRSWFRLHGRELGLKYAKWMCEGGRLEDSTHSPEDALAKAKSQEVAMCFKH